MNWISNLRLQTQIFLVFGILTLISFLGGGLGVRNSLKLSSQIDDLVQNNVGHLQSVNQLNTAFQRMRSDFMLMILSRTGEEANSYAAKCRVYNDEVTAIVERLAKEARGEEKNILADFVTQATMFNRHRQDIEVMAQAGRLEDARTLLFGEVEKTHSAMQQDIAALSAMIEQDATTNAQAGQEMARWTTISLGIGTMTGVIVVVILGLFVVRSVTKPLHQLVESIQNGDLNTVFTSPRKDEIGTLMNSFDRFVKTIKETLLQVVEATAAVASATSEISSSAEQMAAGAQQQSGQTVDVSSAVEEMTKTVFENSKNAGTTAETARTAKQTAEQGGKVVEESVAGMKRIAETVQQLDKTVRALGKSSDHIGKIISVIDDIADQTNLLALNAAIEAARAGEQGRGFAVVADEVRKLAERTTKATKEVAEMIQKIQSDTNEAVTSMEQGTVEVERGIKFADAAGNSLHEIVKISQRVTDMIAQIASASEQQAGASEEISKSIEGISAVTQQTAGGIQQIARTAEDLNRLTEHLEQLTGKFKLVTEDRHADAVHLPQRPNHRASHHATRMKDGHAVQAAWEAPARHGNGRSESQSPRSV